MFIDKVILNYFRNIKNLDVEFSKKINVFHGNNGQGKTNLLEAVFLLSNQKSFRTDTPYEMIHFAQNIAYVGAKINENGLARKVEVYIDGSARQKKYLIDGKSARVTQILDELRSLLVSQEELSCLYGTKQDRRRFLDKAVWNFFPGYLTLYKNYEKILKQRNVIIRDNHLNGKMLSVFNESLVEHGAKVIIERIRFIKEILPLFKSRFSRVYGGEQEVGINYFIQGDENFTCIDSLSSHEVETKLRNFLEKAHRDDLIRGYTTIGPHADDFHMTWMGKSAQKYASQGQKKAILLSEKLAEVELLKKQNIMPVLLLDEVKSDLDDQKIQQLFAELIFSGCQSFVTTTSPKDMEFIEDKEDFKIVSGGVDRNKF